MNKHKYLSILDQTMGLVNAIYLHILVLFVLFKHWFLNLVDLFTGGPPLKDLNSEIVLITGAASGLGKGIAQRLAQLGCTLVLWDVDEKNNILVAEELNNTTNSKRIHAMKCDLTNRENIYQCAKKVQETIGNVTMVINNAGVVSGKHIVDCSDASIQRTFDVNVIAHFWIIKAFLPSMLENNHGHIVTIASAAGLTGLASLVDYCSSKFAAVGLHEALTHELYSLKKFGIKTTVVCPSFINTGMFAGAVANEISPLLKQDKVCDLIVKAIRQNQHQLLIPKMLNISLALNRISSTAAQLEVQSLIGLHQSMDTFTGRQ
jgi:all-trans-retinol dehydrogenase (NAD+)